MNQILCVALALVVGLFSSRLMKLIKLPNVTGYLLAGIIFGPYLLGQFVGWHVDGKLSVSSLSWVSEIALGFIAFTIGSSFKISSLKSVGPKVVIITISESLCGTIFVIIGLMLTKIFLDIPMSIVLTLSAIAAATAPAATLMVVKQYNARGPLVDTLLPVVAFDDAVALILFSILFSISKGIASGNNPSFLDVIVWPLVSIIVSVGVGFGLGWLVTLCCKIFQSRANRMTMSISAILVSVGISLLPFSTWLGFDLTFSSLLSCMMIGAVLINKRQDSFRIFDRFEIFTYPIFMLFFVISGASLDLSIFLSDNALIVIIIALIYIIFRAVGKYIGAFASATATKADPAVKNWLGLTLIPQAGVAIGLSSQASQTLVQEGNKLLANGNFVGEKLVTYGSMILAIILTSTLVYEIIGPVIAKIALIKAGAAQQTH